MNDFNAEYKRRFDNFQDEPNLQMPSKFVLPSTKWPSTPYGVASSRARSNR